nr:MAG TPA: hypothetical protein [Caudoviricetes sp.]
MSIQERKISHMYIMFCLSMFYVLCIINKSRIFVM